MKTVIIGCKGQLGTDMTSYCKKAGLAVYTYDVPEIDITDLKSTELLINKITPELIINCAAYTAVDACETNRDLAFAINAQGVFNIAQAARNVDASVVHISTDYVFDGLKQTPYIETDQTNPTSVYGASKLAGEEHLRALLDKFYILRIAWLFGKNGNNFVKTIRRIAQERQETGEPLSVVNDQFGTPTATGDICKQVLALLKTKQYGLYHCTSEGVCTWFDFAQKIVSLCGLTTSVKACSTDASNRPAPRPPYGVLENHNLKKLGINEMPHWETAISTFIHEELDND